MTNTIKRACLAAMISVVAVQGAQAKSLFRPGPDFEIEGLTCGQFISREDYDQRAILYWIEGKRAQSADARVIDIDAQEHLAASLNDACAAHPDALLITVIEGRPYAAKSLS